MHKKEGGNKIKHKRNKHGLLLSKCMAEHVNGNCHLFRLLFEYSPNPIFLETLSGKIMDCNRAAERTLGYTKEELLNFKKEELLPKNKRKFFPQIIKKIINNGSAVFECENVRKDGTIIPVEAHYKLMHQEGKPIVFAVIIDISHHKKIEDDLRASEENFKKIFNKSAVGIVLVGLDFKFLQANKAAVDIWGYSEKELKKMTFVDLTHPDEIARDKEQIKRLLKGEISVYKVEKRYIRKDGEIIWGAVNVSMVYSVENKPLYFVTTVEDITKKKLSSEGLKDLQIKYSTVVEQSNDGIIVIQDGVVRFFNRMMLAMTGYSRKKIIGKSFLDFIAPKYKKLVADRYAKRLRGVKVPSRYEFEILSKNGKTVPVEINSSQIFFEGRPAILAILRDMTNAREAAEALKLVSIRQEAILAAIPDIVMEVDVKKVYKWANQMGYDFFGSDVIGKQASHYFIGTQETYKIVEPVFVGRKDFIYVESWQRRKDGEKRLLAWWSRVLKDKNGNVTGVLSTARDITEHRKIEQELVRERELYTSLVENSNDGIAILQDDVIKFFNKQIFVMIGYTEVEAFGKPFINFVSDKDKKIVLERFKSRVLGKKVEPRYEVELIKKDGKVLPVEMNASLVNFEGRPAVMSVIRDITKAKEIDKMKSEFVSVASHQLRTPLTGIKWFTELLVGNKSGELSAKQKDYVDQIAIGTNRMINLVDDLLDVSHIEAGEKYGVVLKKQDISDIPKEIIRDQSIQAKSKKVGLELDQDCPSEVIIRADKSKLAQVFENLISNAIKYTPSGGKITIGCKKGEGGVIYFVRDNGVGIPARQMNRLFERFFRGDNVMTTEQGTGLGLYIAKYIVTKHGGKIWCESVENKGSTFYVFLPTV